MFSFIFPTNPCIFFRQFLSCLFHNFWLYIIHPKYDFIIDHLKDCVKSLRRIRKFHLLLLIFIYFYVFYTLSFLAVLHPAFITRMHHIHFYFYIHFVAYFVNISYPPLCFKEGLFSYYIIALLQFIYNVMKMLLIRFFKTTKLFFKCNQLLVTIFIVNLLLIIINIKNNSLFVSQVMFYKISFPRCICTNHKG